MRIVTLPDGARVLGRGRVEPLPDERPDLGLALGRSRPQEVLGDWPTTWLAWRDFGLPTDHGAAAALIDSHGERARGGELLEVCCRGGKGRTGTVLACLVTRSGVGPEDAVSWVREHYDPHAVETWRQRRWVGWFASRPWS